MNENKAEIIGLLCAEGCYMNTYRIFHEIDKRRGNIYLRFKNRRAIDFANFNMILLRRFADLIETEYGFRPKPIKDRGRYAKITLSRKKIIDDLIKYSDYGSLKWSVPKKLFSSDDKVKYSFVRGFFDGDGSADHRRIRLYSTNKKGIYEISELLKSMNVHHTMQGPHKVKGKRDVYTIYICKREMLRIWKYLKPNKI